MQKYINLKQVCTITLNPKKRVWNINYCERKQRIGIVDWLKGKKRPNKFVLIKNTYNDSFILEGKYLEDELNEKHAYVSTDDNQVYYYPHVELNLSDNHVEVKWFKTLDDINNWVSNIRAQDPNIIILND